YTVTNMALVKRHVMTLTGLRPGTTNYFQIDSVSQDVPYHFQGVFLTSPVAMMPPQLYLLFSPPDLTLYWNGTERTLQTIDSLGSGAGWTDAPGQATRSPYVVTDHSAGTKFFRLR